jgi:hypothetical protein
MTNAPTEHDGDDVVVLIPAYNDWGSLGVLLAEIDAVLGAAKLRGRVVVVDDASTIALPDQFLNQRYAHLSSVDLVRLLSGLGHQRAIAVGLAHLHRTGVGAETIVVMDGDGEDRPVDIPRLVEELRQRRCGVAFASRTKRTEPYLFRMMYVVYRLLHRLLTGMPVRWGNFSAVSANALPRLLASPDLWNHYAATVARSRVGFCTVPLPRGKRYMGQSHMNYVSLVMHGLSGIALSGEVIAARLTILFSGLTAILAVLLGVELLARTSFPFWTRIATTVLLAFAAQGLLSALIFALAMLGRRSMAKVLPSRDAEGFIESVVCLFAVEESGSPQLHDHVLEQS